MGGRLAALFGLLASAPTAALAQPSGEAYLSGSVSRQTSPAGSATLTGVAVGFSIGSPTVVFGPELLLQNGDSVRLRAFAVAARLRQGGRWIHPHLAAGLGIYSWQRLTPPDPGNPFQTRATWQDINYVSGMLGGGATVGPWRGRITGVFEARWHRNLEQDSVNGSRSLIGIEAGLRVAW
jgi:hypothetical protein